MRLLAARFFLSETSSTVPAAFYILMSMISRYAVLAASDLPQQRSSPSLRWHDLQRRARYRGEIMRNIRNHLTLDHWNVEHILAMFRSNLDRHRSFSTFFKKTRERLLQNMCDRLSNDDNQVQVAYTLACL
jgi:hypothetical protein